MFVLFFAIYGVLSANLFFAVVLCFALAGLAPPRSSLWGAFLPTPERAAIILAGVGVACLAALVSIRRQRHRG